MGCCCDHPDPNGRGYLWYNSWKGPYIIVLTLFSMTSMLDICKFITRDTDGVLPSVNLRYESLMSIVGSIVSLCIAFAQFFTGFILDTTSKRKPLTIYTAYGCSVFCVVFAIFIQENTWFVALMASHAGTLFYDIGAVSANSYLAEISGGKNARYAVNARASTLYHALQLAFLLPLVGIQIAMSRREAGSEQYSDLFRTGCIRKGHDFRSWSIFNNSTFSSPEFSPICNAIYNTCTHDDGIFAAANASCDIIQNLTESRNATCSLLDAELSCAWDGSGAMEVNEVAQIAYFCVCIHIAIMAFMSGRNFEEREASVVAGTNGKESFGMLVRRILGVLKMTRKRYPMLVRYLFGQAVWYQGSLSILGTITIYLSSQLKLSGLSISVIFLTVMVFVVLGAWLQGFFAKKYGSKVSLLICLFCFWTQCIIIPVLLVSPDTPFILIIAFSAPTGSLMSWTWSGSRACFSDIVVGGMESTYWSLFSFSTNILALFPGIGIAFIIETLDRDISLRVAVWFISFWFLLGGLLLYRVDFKVAEEQIAESLVKRVFSTIEGENVKNAKVAPA